MINTSLVLVLHDSVSQPLLHLFSSLNTSFAMWHWQSDVLMPLKALPTLLSGESLLEMYVELLNHSDRSRISRS